MTNHCLRKLPYASRGDAERAVAAMVRRKVVGAGKVGGGGRLVVYRCQVGDHWHIGHDRRVRGP